MKNPKHMTKTYSTLAGALLLAGALTTTACSNEDMATGDTTTQPAEGRTVLFTATLAPHGDNGTTTRTITVNNQGTANETLTVKWKVGEKIGVYYLKSDGTTHAKAEARVTTVDETTGVATISATLEGAKDDSEVQFVYPASLMNNNGSVNWTPLRFAQTGYLTTPESGSSEQGSGQGQSTVNPSTTNSISSDFDLATGSGTLSVSAGAAVTTDRISLKNQCCICKFNFTLKDPVSTVTHYTIKVAFNGGDTYTLSNIPKDRLSELYVAMRPVSAKATITAEGSKSSDGGQTSTLVSRHIKVINNVELVASTFYFNVPVTLGKAALNPVTGNVTLTSETGELQLGDGAVLTGAGGTNTRLIIDAGATVVLKDLTNTSIEQEANIPGIECLGDATIILEGTNSVTGFWNAPGILVPKGFTLTIKGTGKLTATGGSSGAGIGGTKDTSCGSIVITGGNITATGKGECAGIGSGWAYSSNITCGDITISGGTVTATGGEEAAGIGSGHAYQASNTCGDITISGGTVTATGGAYAAGIGSGNGHNDGSNIYVSSCGAISITGGTVDATGGNHAAGIGSGENGKFANISIGSGITSVTATRSDNYWNVPIGKGNDDRGSGAVTIDGQTLTDAQTQGTTNTTFGSINVTVSSYGSDGGLTWTLTH